VISENGWRRPDAGASHSPKFGDARMDESETLCDLRFGKAEYQLGKPADRLAESCFQISIIPQRDGLRSFVLAEKNGEQFAVDLRLNQRNVTCACQPVLLA
jgi:hypothetical protein